MELCILAKIVLLLAIISMIFHVCFAGFTIWFLADILGMALFVFITNRYCEHWIAKGIVIYAIIGTLVYFFMCVSKNKLYQKNLEYEEKRI
jgi:hypothetical protein